MTDRDRLIELFSPFADGTYNGSGTIIDGTKVDDVVDNLLANGVIVLPCQKGVVLNRNGEKCIANHWNIILTAFNENNQVRLFDVKEAEEKLKELQNG